MALRSAFKVINSRSKLCQAIPLYFVRAESQAVFYVKEKRKIPQKRTTSTEGNRKNVKVKAPASGSEGDKPPALVSLILKGEQSNKGEDSLEMSTAQVSSSDGAEVSVEELEMRLKEINWDAKALWEKSKLDATLSFTANNVKLNKDVAERSSLDISDFKFMLGTGDPSVDISDVPCSGCGAILHCNDPSVPGFLPSQKFVTLTREEMRKSKCQKCHLMHHYKVILDIKASDDEFKTIIRQIRREKALILVVIDLLDMQNSVLSHLFKYISQKRPIYVVGNKVDLMPKDKKGYLKRIENALLTACNESGLNPTGDNIRHVALVSAKTGYGIEQLVTKLMLDWGLNGNVYMVGNTNSGKSTLFNALLHSDYCKSSVRDVIQSATVSIWPGTTINLLKFPIINPEPWRLYKRTMRVRKERQEWHEAQLQKMSKIKEKKKVQDAVSLATLQAPVNVTNFERKGDGEDQAYEGFTLPTYSFSGDGLDVMEGREHILSEEDKNPVVLDDNKFKHAKFFFDTPGVIDNSQVINLLSCDELEMLLPKGLIIPRVFLLKPNHVMFITGLACLEYVNGNQDLFVTVFGRSGLPVHVKNKDEAFRFYEDFVGTSVLGIPLGDRDRLNKIPSLVGKHFHVQGDCQEQQAIADIQLSSLGWVSLSPTLFWGEMDVEIRAYTPGAQGLHLRQPSMILGTHFFHGTRKGKSYEYRLRKPALYTH